MNRDRFDNHHGQWDARRWRMEAFTRRIREHPGMILHGVWRPTHEKAHREIPPVQPPGRTLAILALSHLNGLSVRDGREGFVLQADFLWHLSNEDSEFGNEAYIQAQHLEHQIEFFGLRSDVA